MTIGPEARYRYDYLLRLLRAQVPPPARLIELGAAPGDQICTLADEGYDATALDLGIASDQWSTDGSPGRMASLLAEHGVSYVEWDLEQHPYPLPEAHYDAVVFTEVFEHLRDYPVRSLQEVHRVLRPGGRLYFTTPNAAYLMNRIRLLAGRSVYTPMPDWIGGVIHARHAREYLFEEIHAAMAGAGLEILSSQSRHFYVSDSSPVRAAVKRGLDRLARWRRTLGPEIVIVAERPA